jgi:hypothetical protein
MMVAQNSVAVLHGLMERVCDARRRSDALFSVVRPGSLYERPIPERHRIIFYVGHLEAFDWNLLHENIFSLKSFHPEFDRLFAFGIDPVSGGLPSDQPSDWPSLDAVHDYVTRVRDALDEKLADGALESRAQTRDGFPVDSLLSVAVEHRLMHVETRRCGKQIHRNSTALRWFTGWLRCLRVWRHSAFAAAPKTSVGTMSMKPT